MLAVCTLVLSTRFTSVPKVASEAVSARSDSMPLSLRQALVLGDKGNLQLEASRQDAAGARAAAAKAEAAYYPILSGTLGVQNAGTSPSTVAPSTVWAPGVTLGYDLGTDGSRRFSVQQAEASAKIAQWTTVLQGDRMTLDVTNGYYDLQSAEEQVKIDRTAVHNARKSLAAAEAMRQAGMGTAFDTERAQTELASARQNLVTALGQAVIARSNVARLVGLALDSPIVASDPVTAAGTWSYSLDDSDRQAIATRPEIAQARLDVRIADLSRDLAYSSVFPKTSLLASVTGAQALWAGGQRITGAPGQLGLQTTLGVSASLPLFGTAVAAGVAQGQSAVTAAKLREGDAARTLKFQVEQAFRQLQSSFINIATSKQALQTSKDALDAALERFKAGVGTQTDVIAAENDYTTAQGNHLAAVIGYNKALASLRVLTGDR